MNTLSVGFLLALSAASATLIGWALIALKKNISEKFVAFLLLLVAGAMIAVSLGQILPATIEANLSFYEILLWLIIGTALVFLLTRNDDQLVSEKKRLKNSSWIIMAAIALHNFPEGMAPIASTLVDFKTGLTTAIILALHNIPEGLAIAATARLAGYSISKAFYFTAIATVAEALGAVTVFIFGGGFDEISTARLLAFVAGIMITVSGKELIPYSARILLKERKR
jgi:zinc transporter, ZIP family